MVEVVEVDVVDVVDVDEVDDVEENDGDEVDVVVGDVEPALVVDVVCVCVCEPTPEGAVDVPGEYSAPVAAFVAAVVVVVVVVAADNATAVSTEGVSVAVIVGLESAELSSLETVASRTVDGGITVLGWSTRSRTCAIAPQENPRAIRTVSTHPAASLNQLGMASVLHRRPYATLPRWLGFFKVLPTRRMSFVGRR